MVLDALTEVLSYVLVHPGVGRNLAGLSVESDGLVDACDGVSVLCDGVCFRAVVRTRTWVLVRCPQLLPWPGVKAGSLLKGINSKLFIFGVGAWARTVISLVEIHVHRSRHDCLSEAQRLL